jgi:hypothetical protein
MSAFNTTVLLSAWEEASSYPPVYRAVSLLAAAWPERPAGEWARLRLGARDGALLDLQDALFGADLETTAVCPQCGERVEMAFTTAQVRAPKCEVERLTVEHDGYLVDCRLPNSEDLLGLPQTTAETARAALLARCLERVQQDGKPIVPEALPPPVIEAIAGAMAEADPQADVLVAIECPICGHRWSTNFDITSYLWRELQEWAHQTLRDVHALASAYGWSEHEVLALSPSRRRLYLEMVEG